VMAWLSSLVLFFSEKIRRRRGYQSDCRCSSCRRRTRLPPPDGCTLAVGNQSADRPIEWSKKSEEGCNLCKLAATPAAITALTSAEGAQAARCAE
jgi:hypothetical protein